MDERQEQARVRQLIQQAQLLRWDRRQILKRAAIFGLSVPAISAVLAACGGDDDDDPTATTAAGDATATTGGADPTATEGEAEPTGTEGGGADPTATEGTGADPTATEAMAEPTATSGAPSGGGGGIINIPTTGGDSGIGNPILASNLAGIEYNVFNRLMTFDDEGTLQPDLAESWEFNDDDTVLTLNLVEANWHDGEPFTADDVIFTFDTIQAEGTDTDLRGRLQVGGEYLTWEKVDDRTITITTPTAFAPMLFNLNNIAIIPMHILDGQDVNTSDFNRAPVGTGAFVLGEWVPDQFVRMERNEDYFKTPAMADGLTYFFMADSNAASAALEAGEIDMFFTPPELQERYLDSSDFTLQNYVYYTSITLAFNYNHPILQDVAVRKAIEMAIDKDSWTATVTRGRGIVSHNQYAEGGPLDRYNDYDNIEIPVYDPEAAMAALDGLGWVPGSDGIREQGGERMSFNVITYSGFDEYQNGMVILQDQMAQIGIEVTPNVVEFTTLEGMWIDPEDDPNNRALELEEWPHPFEFDPDVYDELHTDNLPPNGGNYMWYSNPDVDALIDEGRTTTDPDARVEVYRQLDVVRAADLPCIPLYLAVDGWVTSNLVLGADGQPFTSDYFRWAVLTRIPEMWKEA